MKPVGFALLSTLVLASLAGCAASAEDGSATGDDQNVTADDAPKKPTAKASNLCETGEKVLFSCQKGIGGQPIEGAFLSLCAKGKTVQFRQGTKDDSKKFPATMASAESVAEGGPISNAGTKGAFATIHDTDVDVVVVDVARSGAAGAEIGEQLSGALFLSKGGTLENFMPCHGAPKHELPSKLIPTSTKEFDTSVLPR